MVVDTNIFVDYLRGGSEAVGFIENNQKLSTSPLALMELILGFDKKTEITRFEKLLSKFEVRVYPVTQKVSDTAYEIFKKNYHRVSIGIADALIFATAIVHDEKMATLNLKHYEGIGGTTVIKPY